jgi:GNAT superfamily N-acetyltransferase
MTTLTITTTESDVLTTRTKATWMVDDAAVALRPLRPSDVMLVDEMHRRLSPESLYARYFQYRIPSLDEIAAVCRMRPEQGAGFVATVHKAADMVIGLTYYVREAHGRDHTAEIGILVEDRYQGQGIGRRLWQHLHEYAAANQFRALRVLSDTSNHRMLRLVQGSGFAYRAQTAWGLNEYLVSLGEPAPASKSPAAPIRSSPIDGLMTVL